MSAVIRLSHLNLEKVAAFDREQAIREVRKEALFLGNILETSSQPFGVGYLDGRLGLTNHAFEELTGYSKAELQQLDWGKFLTPIEWQAYEDELLVSLINTGKPIRYEKEYFRKDGSRVPVELLVHLVCDAQGQPDYFYSFITDITERKQAENALEQLNNELEDRVKIRTNELATLNQSLESFVYSVSHDLKSPLRGIDGYSQLLQSDYGGLLDEEGKQFLQNISTGIKRMNDLIDDLLAYSRMSRRKLEDEPVDINALLDNIVQERKVYGAAQAPKIEVNLPPLIVDADKEGLALVLRNLLQNALKFSQHNPEPHIEIGATEDVESVTLWINDNGIGFDMKYVERIFEIFQRLNRQEEFPGTGIGLAMVKMAMQRMGGNVWAESAPDQGATFFIRLLKKYMHVI